MHVGLYTDEEILYFAKKYADKRAPGDQKILCGSTADWNANPSLVSERGTVYIYTDKEYDTATGTKTAPAIKLGDGLAYVVDLPFFDEEISEQVIQRIADMSGSVTPEEKMFWNNKVTAYLNGNDLEELVLSKTNYVINGDIYYG